MAPKASIVIPTRARPDYLQVALASIAPQARRAGAEVLVVDDAGESDDARALAARFGGAYVPHPGPLGLNAARNTGVANSSGELVVFVDDDVRAHPDWLAALLTAAERHQRTDVFTGPIRPVLEGARTRSCARGHEPVTSLDLGGADTTARFAWGANMAIRRRALERIGPFDTSIAQGGDEQEWQERLLASGSEPARYIAGAAVDHRRAGADARLPALARGAFTRGSAARRFDARRALAPSLASELTTLARCLGHVALQRCPAGLPQAAHSVGRVSQALRDLARTRSRGDARAAAANAQAGDAAPTGVQVNGSDDFMSGTSGTVGGKGAILRGAGDAAYAALDLASGRRARLARRARHEPPRRRVLVLGVQRAANHWLAARAQAELARSRHDVELYICEAGGRGKFENLNLLLAAHPAAGHDWLLVIDDDVELPRGFLDRLLFACERFELALAQPAHALRSHAAWPQTRRRPNSIARVTPFVEIGPVGVFSARTFDTLLPFPQLRMGWGLDLHWAAVAREHGWRCGVIDAVAILHRAAPVASEYSRAEAVAEARDFLQGRPYLRASEAQRTLAVHRRL
ncbi:MAG TPA: glycosyltransferase family A protein [Solirubrobacteraceae bacterium]|jgi:GT2 family glycosyltransferase|nr:glycosyltransferase family A protein [Solirubrobacteraceae bacterium]